MKDGLEVFLLARLNNAIRKSKQIQSVEKVSGSVVDKRNGDRATAQCVVVIMKIVITEPLVTTIVIV